MKMPTLRTRALIALVVFVVVSVLWYVFSLPNAIHAGAITLCLLFVFMPFIFGKKESK